MALLFLLAPAQGLPQDAREVYEQLQNPTFDATKVARVADLVMARDRGRIRFSRGSIYFARPVAGRVLQAVFIGEGSFELRPPTDIEKYQVRRFLKTDSIKIDFSKAFFAFSDSTASELMGKLEPEPGKVPADASKLSEKILKLLLDDRGFNLSSRLLSDFFSPGQAGLFFAVFEHVEENLSFPGYYLFTVDPQAREEVGVFQYFPHRAGKPFYTLCSFHLADEYDTDEHLRQRNDNKDVLRIRHYNMKVTLEKSGRLEASATLSFETLAESFKVVTFDLHKDLKVDSVTISAGDSLLFFKEKKESAVTVVLPTAARKGAQQSLTIHTSGNMLENRDGNYLLKHNTLWYPRYGYFEPATYDLTFKYPENMNVVATGVLKKEWQEDGLRVSQWQESVPSLATAFAFGRFDVTMFDQASVPVEIFSSKHYSKSVRRKIGGDVASSFYFFQRMLGSYPRRQLRVVETPGQVSTGFPGILFLTRLTYEVEYEGVMEELRAHEVSHQWWGGIVGWKTYHDQWLSEGLAEYSGALMNQFLLADDKRFFQALEGWRNDLLEQGHIGVSLGLRRFGFSKADLSQSDGISAGPPWLGVRLTEKYPVDYFVNVYEKGAYVVHMLRTMLRDFETGSDARFWAMMADFVQTHKGRKADTQDFKAIADKHFNQDMGWFFQQWIYDVAVPTYRYDYQVSQEDGEYFVDVSVAQEDVPPAFKAFIPIGVQFVDAPRKTELIEMTGAEKAFKLGPFQNLPKRIIFNDFGGVLARVKRK